MKLLIASDKFKGSLSALEVAVAIKEGVRENGNFKCVFHPMADGGDGSLEVLKNYLKLEKVNCMAQDPLGRAADTYYYSNGNTAYVELAVATGLVRLKDFERNPMYTSTYGTGEQILHAIHSGHQIIYLFLGGSSTNDCGIGIASALGYRFLDENRNELAPIGKNLEQIHIIDNKKFRHQNIEFHIVCDVNNPLYGENGAARIYARQKGASEEEITCLDNGLRSFAQLLLKTSNIEVNDLPGAGAAGGIGAGMTTLMDAAMIGGFEFMSEMTNLEEAILNADVVISGEGKIDRSSLYGKVINGIAALCKKYHKPLYLFCGSKSISEEEEKTIGVEKVYAIMDIAESEKEAMSKSKALLSQLATEFVLDLTTRLD